MLQMPIFISMFFALKTMPELYPSMTEGGTLWFTDLSVADESYALPVMSALSFLLILEVIFAHCARSC
jgi:YidC/Oxa1 family membrane protein insertase